MTSRTFWQRIHDPFNLDSFNKEFRRHKLEAVKRKQRNMKRKRARFSTTKQGSFRKRKRRRTQNVRSGGLLGIELKFEDYEVSGEDCGFNVWASLNPTPQKCLNGVTQGHAEDERIGKSYLIKSLQIKYIVLIPGTITSATHDGEIFVRLAIVLDSQTNGAQMDPEDPWEPTDSNPLLAWRDLESTTRFRVLMDKKFIFQAKTVSIGTTGGFSSPKQSTNILQKFITFNPPLKIVCQDPGATVSSIIDNSIHIMGITNADGDVRKAQVSYVARIRYVDR